MKYFAYGSNMCTNRLGKRAPSCKFCAVAALKGYEVKFHKRSRKDGSGKCNAYRTGNQDDEVIGALFEIDPLEKEDLARYEGVGYHETSVSVVSAGRVITAFTYVADAETIDDSLAPYTWYKDFVVAGALEHGLPKTYIQKLEAVRADNDSDKKREETERRLLPCR